MGCTSSAPSPPITQNNSDLNTFKLWEKMDDNPETEKERNDVIHADKENETNAINVLPHCDKLKETTQLVRNSTKSSIDTTVMEKKDQGLTDKSNDHVMEREVEPPDIKDETKLEELQTEDKISKMEDVVEKVVELFVSENILERKIGDLHSENENSKNFKNTDSKSKDQSTNKSHEIQDDDDADVEGNFPAPLEEVVSPSASQSSRATRWEALADAAAELPPSLTVDPITGQIYALK